MTTLRKLGKVTKLSFVPLKPIEAATMGLVAVVGIVTAILVQNYYAGGTGIPSAAGVPMNMHVIPASHSGKITTCNGHVIAPEATGCTSSGGVIFTTPPHVVTKK